MFLQMNKIIRILLICCLHFVFFKASGQVTKINAQMNKILGMYIHEGWSYNRPYASRSWTLEDWHNYLDGIQKLGYNSILIWPMLENMPKPITLSDKFHIEKTSAVIDMARTDFNMKVFIVLCPNVGPNSDVGKKYTFENRPFYSTQVLIDPGNAKAFKELMSWRQKLFKSLAKADGIFVIDSDPGGFANSTNLEFASVLAAHRHMLNKLRPGIEIYYWAHTGWESYGRFHATGHFKMGAPKEIQDALILIDKQKIEPWGVASGGNYGPHIADTIELGNKVLAYNYGHIEGEPSFPLTIYGSQLAYEGGRNTGSRGVFGNAQTNSVQLPNTFAFSRGALGETINKEDYVAFANELIVGHGEQITEGWDALQGNNARRMKAIAERLGSLASSTLKTGKFKGLVFGDAHRFVDDLVCQLHMAADLILMNEILDVEPKNKVRLKGAFATFLLSVDRWHIKHGYNSHWNWPLMTEVLKKLNSSSLNPILNAPVWWESNEGETPAERIKNAYEKVESYTPRLIRAMKAALNDIS